MKLAYITAALVLTLCTAAATNAQRSLESAEALEILEKLASRQPATWLPAGTIEARHREYRAPETTESAEIDAAIEQEVQEYQVRTDRIERTAEMQKLYLDAIPFNIRYKLANEYTMTSTVTVKYDGDRFYWEIDVSSRTDSVTPASELVGNYMLDRFDVNRHDRRVFVWDGQQYTIHTVSANHAIVDAANQLPHAVNGPLTAGIIPWGQGALSLDNLSTAEISAAEVVRDGITQIEMTIEPAKGSSLTCALDPAKDYAATSYTLIGLNNKVTSQYYSDYQQVAGNWVPTTILIEQHDLFSGRLLASDQWDLTVVDSHVPGAEQFDTAYRADTIIEYYSSVSTKASVYHYSNAADTDQLLAEHLTYTTTKSGPNQNCATVALKYAAAQLGKSIPDDKLAPLVAADGQTTLEDLKQLAQGQGLYCRAVRTDLATLRNLPDCQAILHIPGRNHFVVLDRVDDRDAWIVDLSKPMFYYRKDKSFLPLDWSEGTALLLSTRPVAGSLAEIDNRTLGTLSGGDGWTCTLLLQENSYILCTMLGSDDCGGTFKWYYERWGCEAAPSGYCSTGMMARYAKDGCYWDWSRPTCATMGNWIIAYMDACD